MRATGSKTPRPGPDRPSGTPGTQLLDPGRTTSQPVCLRGSRQPVTSDYRATVFDRCARLDWAGVHTRRGGAPCRLRTPCGTARKGRPIRTSRDRTSVQPAEVGRSGIIGLSSERVETPKSLISSPSGEMGLPEGLNWRRLRAPVSVDDDMTSKNCSAPYESTTRTTRSMAVAFQPIIASI